MTSPSFRKFPLLLVLTVLFLSACGEDDPVSPQTPLWQEVTLELPEGDSQLHAIDFEGGHGLALAVRKTSGKDWAAENLFFKLQPDGSWLPEDLGEIPGSNLFIDLALDPAGRPVLAGYRDSSPLSVLLDFRSGQPTYFTNGTRGLLTVDGEGSFMVAGGRARGGDLWTSTSANAWNFDDVIPPLTGNNDSGFRDVYIRGDRAVACGFDDGADTLQVILERTATTGWTKISTAGPGTRTFFCVALSEAGSIFVGGIEGAGGPTPKAFLAQRTADGLWTDLVLPDPEDLHGVQDILLAGDDTIYLACMGEGDQTRANLIHASSRGVSKEISPFPGGLLQLGEANNGDIIAVGFRRDEATGGEIGVMLSKPH